ncbi:MAG: ABC transporter substrate-binding protein [Oscillospiraceae bacterium]|nr:ABC transporter substrate-binding protein [Oscillospiraceae bacterium]
MKKIKIIATLLCVVMLFSIAACNKNNDANTNNNNDASNNNSSSTNDSGTNTNDNSSTNTNNNSSSNTNDTNTDNSNTDNTGSTSGKDTINIVFSGDTGTLDAVNMSGGSAGVPSVYMEPMWRLMEGMEYEWVLATGLDEVSPTQWIIHVREGVKFSNGNTLTADDILFTLKLWRDTPNRALQTQSLDLDNSSVIDDYTLDLRLTEYNVAQMPMLSTTLITDSKTYDPLEAAVNPVGTGPYIVTEYVVNSYIRLAARDDYWGKKPAIPNMVFRHISEPAQIVNALVTGMVDIATVPSADIEYIKTLPGYNVYTRPSGTGTMALFNTDAQSPFHDADARLAVCLAIDRNAIVNLVYNGYAEVSVMPVSKGNIDFEQRFSNLGDSYSIGYNVDLAKQYADSSGLTGKDVRVMTNGDPSYVTMAEIIQANLKDIGVSVTILNYDQATLRSLYRTDPTSYDICLSASAAPTYMVADVMYAYVAFSTIISAPGAWDGVEEYMELGSVALGGATPQIRSDALFEMLKLFTAQNPWFGLCDPVGSSAYSKDLGEIVFNAYGAVLYQDLSFN